MLVMLLHCPLQFAAVEGQLGERDLALCTHTERTRESSRRSTFVSSLSVRISLSGRPGSGSLVGLQKLMCRCPGEVTNSITL